MVKPKTEIPVKDSLPEFKDVRKRDKIVFFLDDAEQAALARIAASKNRLNSLPLDEWKDHAIVVSSQIAKGTTASTSNDEVLMVIHDEAAAISFSDQFDRMWNDVKGFETLQKKIAQ